MQFFLLLLQILPYLPGLVRTVESIHGAGNGQAKLASAIQLIGAVVPAVSLAIANSPDNQSRLETVIGSLVAALNAAGTMHAAPPTPPGSGAAD